MLMLKTNKGGQKKIYHFQFCHIVIVYIHFFFGSHSKRFFLYKNIRKKICFWKIKGQIIGERHVLTIQKVLFYLQHLNRISKYFELFCLCKRQVHSLDSAKNLVLPQKYYIRKCYLKSINNIKYIRRRIFDGIS